MLDLIIQYLGKEAPKRDKEKAGTQLITFWEDCDRQGTSIDDFFKEVATLTGLFGRYFIVVDRPAERGQTALDDEKLKLRPYVYGVSPLDVLDYEIDPATGDITQALIREYTRGPINLLKEREDDDLLVRYRVWVKTEAGVLWVLFKKDKDDNPVEIGRGSISIDRVPIVMVKRTGGSLIDDIATLDRKIYNYESLLDQILYDQTFSTLVIEFHNSLDDFFDNWSIKLGTKSIIPFPKDGTPPAYISPDASQGTLIVEAIEKKTTQIYQVKNLQDTVGNAQQGKPAAAESGIAKGYDFEKLNAGLAIFADDLEKAEKTVAELVNLWNGATEAIDPDLIDYPDQFDVKTLTQELTEYTLLAGSIQSETYRKFLQKGLVKKATPKLEEDVAKKVDAEIDASRSMEDIEKEQATNANKLKKE